MGYGGLRQHVGRVDLVKWLPRFPPEGPGVFTIKGFDGRHKMMNSNEFITKQTKKSVEVPVPSLGTTATTRTITKFGTSRIRRTSYSGMPDEEIVKKIAQKYGYGVDADPTEVKKRIATRTVPLPSTGTTPTTTSIKVAQKVFATRPHPTDMTDWAFLQKLAAINRFDLWVDYDLTKKRWVIHFKKRPDAGSAEYLFTYNYTGDGSLIEAEPDFSIHEQPTDVEVLFYDKRLHKVQRTVINDLNPSENVNLTSASPGNLEAKKTISRGARVRFSAFGQTIEALADRPFRSKKEAETFVKNWLRERERDLLILKGRVVGIETLKPRQIHQFQGMSKRLDGFYRFSQTRHTMVPGQIYDVSFVGHKVLSQEITRRKATTRVQGTLTKRQS
jgi:hypothetical protein